MWQLNLKCSHFTMNLNISFCVQNNMEAAHILDHYVIGRMVIVSTALELVAFAWIYGELSVGMATGIRYVDSHSCLEFSLIGFLNIGTYIFPTTLIWIIYQKLACGWSLQVYLNQSERRHHKQQIFQCVTQYRISFLELNSLLKNQIMYTDCCT